MAKQTNGVSKTELTAEQYELATPRPAALIESMRSVGYSLSTALADLIDNSITASAKTVHITFNWAGSNSWIAIIDDGDGMSEARLLEAMRPGTQSPLEQRSTQDLGRFGLGLKTASFSQCRNLAVATRTNGAELAIRRWDLDYVEKHNEWRLLKSIEPGTASVLTDLMPRRQGTLVLWRKLDRVVDDRPVDDDHAHEAFQALISEVKAHLSMTFHRFLAGKSSLLKGPLRIFVNGTTPDHELKSWDPFLRDHPATQPSPNEVIGEAGSEVRVRGFVLPHKDLLTEEQYQSAAGPKGWNAQQGFYIYRNDRVLVPGDWLRLGRTSAWQREEHYRLARLSIDITNTQDFDWSLDVKKSMARPPSSIRERLTDLAEVTRKRARDVFFHRGEMGPRPAGGQTHPIQRPWISTIRSGHSVYRINREHPTVAGVLQKLGPLKEDANALLRLIEETVPVERIWLDVAEAPGVHAIPYEGLDEGLIWSDLKRTFELMKGGGYTTGLAIQYLGVVEPFSRYPSLLAKLEQI